MTTENSNSGNKKISFFFMVYFVVSSLVIALLIAAGSKTQEQGKNNLQQVRESLESENKKAIELVVTESDAKQKALISTEIERWHKTLIEAGFAEYDRKTGEWHLLSLSDLTPSVSSGSGLIATGTLNCFDGILPTNLPEPEEVAEKTVKKHKKQ